MSGFMPARESVRPVRDADGPSIARLMAACFTEYEGCIFAIDEFPELMAPARWASDNASAIWVIDGPDGEIAGSICAAPASDGRVELRKFYLAQHLRGSGVAIQLLGKVLAFADERSATAIILWSDTRFTRAHRFYEKHGFVRSPGMRTVEAAETYTEFAYSLTLARASGTRP